MVKRIFTAIAILMASCALGKGASQEWVLEQIQRMTGTYQLKATVTTNATTGAIKVESPFTCTNIPDCVALSIGFIQTTNAAIRLSNSTIPGVSGGCWAWSETLLRYVNCSNAVMSRIFAHVAGSNETGSVVYSATGLDGTLYESSLTNGYIVLAAVTNASWRATVCRLNVDADEASRLTGPSAAVSSSFNPLLGLFLTTAHADVTVGGSPGSTPHVNFTVGPIEWMDKLGNRHPFNPSKIRFMWHPDLPDMPSEDHVCELDEHCNCSGINPDQTVPDVFETPSEDDLGETVNWITDVEWSTFGGTIQNNGTMIARDDDGYTATMDQIVASDAFQRMFEEAKSIIRSYYKECQTAYKASMICPKVNPQHAFATFTCATTWRLCGRCGLSDGTENHGGPYASNGASGHKCRCAAKSYGHTMGQWTEGTSTTTTRTFTRSCNDNCGYTENETHTHNHANCAPCTGILPNGIRCNIPCQTCGGDHNFEGNPCHKCTCTGCTTYPTDKALHTGWHQCGQDDDDNEDGSANGSHCACACLMFGHNANTPHAYSGVFTRQKKTPEDASNHWKTKTCTLCQYAHRTSEAHDFTTIQPTYTQDGEVCRKTLTCNDCGQTKTENKQHVRGYNCKCSNCKTYQFTHDFTGQDACGNEICTYCLKYYADENSSAIRHIQYQDHGDGTHRCSCDKSGYNHKWGTAYIIEETDNYVVYRRECTGEGGSDLCTAYVDNTEYKKDDDRETPPGGGPTGSEEGESEVDVDEEEESGEDEWPPRCPHGRSIEVDCHECPEGYWTTEKEFISSKTEIETVGPGFNGGMMMTVLPIFSGTRYKTTRLYRINVYRSGLLYSSSIQEEVVYTEWEYSL